MLWMDMWVHPYTDTPLKVGVDFWEMGVLLLSVSHVVKSWWRLQSTIDCIPHPYHIYTKCFSTLICCGWARRCTLAPFYLCTWGWLLRKLSKWQSPSDVVKSWLRLQSLVDCIPHPYHLYIMCFSTLICCGWTCGCTLTLIRLWRWVWIFGKLGVWLSPEPEWCNSHGWGFKAP